MDCLKRFLRVVSVFEGTSVVWWIWRRLWLNLIRRLFKQLGHGCFSCEKHEPILSLLKRTKAMAMYCRRVTAASQPHSLCSRTWLESFRRNRSACWPTWYTLHRGEESISITLEQAILSTFSLKVVNQSVGTSWSHRDTSKQDCLFEAILQSSVVLGGCNSSMLNDTQAIVNELDSALFQTTGPRLLLAGATSAHLELVVPRTKAVGLSQMCATSHWPTKVRSERSNQVSVETQSLSRCGDKKRTVYWSRARSYKSSCYSIVVGVQQCNALLATPSQ